MQNVIGGQKKASVITNICKSTRDAIILPI